MIAYRRTSEESNKVRWTAMAFSFSERLQIVYGDNSNKYNIENEAEEEQLSTIEFVNIFRDSCCIF